MPDWSREVGRPRVAGLPLLLVVESAVALDGSRGCAGGSCAPGPTKSYGRVSPVDRVPCDHGAIQGDLAVTGSPEADALVNTGPLALLLGMLLDQHMQ